MHNPKGVSRFDRARPRPGLSGWVWEVFEHFSGDVAFQDAGDLTHGLALGEATSDVIAGGLVVSHPGDDEKNDQNKEDSGAGFAGTLAGPGGWTPTGRYIRE